MRRRRINHAITGEHAPEEVTARASATDVITMLNSVTVTPKEIIFPKSFKRVYISFDEIVWAYLQVAESHVTLGCCGGVLQEFRVVTRTRDGGSTMIIYDREDNARQLLKMIEERSAGVAIGFTAENKAKFGMA